MPFGVVSGVGREMDVFDEGGDRQRGRAVSWVNLGRETDSVRGGDALFPNDFREDLFTLSQFERACVLAVTPINGSMVSVDV